MDTQCPRPLHSGAYRLWYFLGKFWICDDSHHRYVDCKYAGETFAVYSHSSHHDRHIWIIYAYPQCRYVDTGE